MGAAIGQIAKKPDQVVATVLQYNTVTGRRREAPYLWGFGALLSTWFIMMVFLTARLFRKTFGPTLGSYAIGRLMVGQSGLVIAHSVGDMATSERACEAFKRVGDTNPTDARNGYVAPAVQEKDDSQTSATGADVPTRARSKRPPLSPKLNTQHTSYGARLRSDSGFNNNARRVSSLSQAGGVE